MRVYEKDFKEEAIKLANEIGPSKAAEKLGIPPSTLTGWRNAKEKYNDVAFVGSGKQRILPTTAKEVQLMKEIRELKKANEILKEALGFFAKSQNK